MKNLIYSVFRMLFVFILFMLIIQPADAFSLVNVPEHKGFADYVQANWAQIALVISEAAALLPGKVKGIVQGILSIIPMLFKSKSAKK